VIHRRDELRLKPDLSKSSDANNARLTIQVFLLKMNRSSVSAAILKRLSANESRTLKNSLRITQNPERR
jgi:hypothetical protein